MSTHALGALLDVQAVPALWERFNHGTGGRADLKPEAPQIRDPLDQSINLAELDPGTPFPIVSCFPKSLDCQAPFVLCYLSPCCKRLQMVAFMRRYCTSWWLDILQLGDISQRRPCRSKSGCLPLVTIAAFTSNRLIMQLSHILSAARAQLSTWMR